MKKTYQLKTNAIKGEQQVIDIAPGTGKAPVVVPAAAAARYELIDTATRAAPDTIRVMRNGKNLQVFFDGEKEPGAVIENYYEAHTDGSPTLVGSTEQGALYEYIPENASSQAITTQLADSGNTYGMALGGQELPATGAAVGLLAPVVGAISPWLLGAGALGAAAVVGGGKGGTDTVVVVKPNGGNALGLSIDLDTSNDGVINGQEKGSASTTSLTAKFDKTKVAAGNTITLSDGTKTETITLTETDVSVGYVVSKGWALPSEGSTLTVTATLKDAAGNTTPLATDAAKIDTTSGIPGYPDPNPLPNTGEKTAISLNPVSGDNVLMPTENSGTTSITGKVSGTFNVGDVVTVFVNGKAFTGQVAVGGGFGIQVPTSDLSTDKDSKIEAQIKGTGGDTATAAQDYVVELNNSVTKTALSIDPVTADNFIAAGEKGGLINITGQVTGKFAEGDKVTITINDKPYITLTDAAGKFVVAVPASELMADWDSTVDGKVTEADGTLAAAVQNYGRDTATPEPTPAPSLKTALTINPIAQDNILSTNDKNASVIEVSGKITGSFASGDTVHLAINGKDYTAQADSSGNYKASINTEDLTADADHQIEASVVGTGGQSANAIQHFMVETDNTAGKTTALFIDPITADNILNSIESSSDSTLITGKVTGKFSAGDSVTLLVNESNVTGTVDATGKYAIAVKNTDLILDNGTTVDAFITGSGGTSASALQNYGVDTVGMDFSPTAGTLNGVNSGVFESAVFKHGTLEKGTYKLHVGDKVFEGQLDKNIGFDIAWASPTPVEGTNIYLETWDVAGNYMKAGLDLDQAKLTWNLSATTHFIV